MFFLCLKFQCNVEQWPLGRHPISPPQMVITLVPAKKHALGTPQGNFRSSKWKTLTLESFSTGRKLRFPVQTQWEAITSIGTALWCMMGSCIRDLQKGLLGQMCGSCWCRVSCRTRHYHDNLFGDHLGIAKTVGEIRQRFNWYQLRVDVREHIRQCPVCCQNRKQVKPNFAGLGQYLAGYPLDRIGVDVLGPLPLTARWNRCILVIGDYFTRWMEAYSIPDQTAETVANALVHRFIATFGCPWSCTLIRAAILSPFY